MGAKYCDHRDSCLYIGIDVSMSVHSRVSKRRPNSTKFSVCVASGHGLVRL